MCVIVLKPKDVPFPSEGLLRNCWQSNPDGAGMAWAQDGRIVFNKGFMLLKDLLASVEGKQEELQKYPVLLHFRVRTDGQRSVTNTHPFAVGPWENEKPETQGVMAHNGHFPEHSSGYGELESDTAKFVKVAGKEFSLPIVRKIKKEFGNIIGTNKLAFLYANGEHVIINEQMGTWKDDMWFSNSGSLGRSFCTTGGGCD